jgi:antitoxin HicB
MEYRARLERDSNNTILVSFPDLPGAHSHGTDEEDALAHGVDAAVTLIEALIKDRRPVPMPTQGRGPRVRMPALLAAKVALHNEMLHQRVNKSELGRRLNQHLPQIDRLVDVRHGSKLDQLEAAFGALGKCLEISMSAVPPKRRSVAAERTPRVKKAARR